MPGLVDIIPAEEDVAGVRVRGLSVRALAALMQQFPALARIMGGLKTDPSDLMRIAPEAVAAVIVSGADGDPEDDDAEATAESLPLDLQLDLLGAILRVTLPKPKRKSTLNLKVVILDAPPPRRRSVHEGAGYDLAAAVEFLIANGHPNALDYTPRLIEGLVHFARRRVRMDRALDLHIATLGSRGEWDKVKKQIEDFEKG